MGWLTMLRSRVSEGSGDVGRVSLGGEGLLSGEVGGRFVYPSAHALRSRSITSLMVLKL